MGGIVSYMIDVWILLCTQATSQNMSHPFIDTYQIFWKLDTYQKLGTYRTDKYRLRHEQCASHVYIIIKNIKFFTNS